VFAMSVDRDDECVNNTFRRELGEILFDEYEPMISRVYRCGMG